MTNALNKKIAKRNSISIPMHVVLAILSVVFLFPIVWMFLSSFKGYIELFKYPPSLLPESFAPTNYVKAFKTGNWFTFFGNTTFVTVMSTILCVAISEMGGYAFAKYKFKGSNTLFLLFIATLMLPLEVLMIPIFLMVKKMGLYNSLWGLIIPPAATPFGIFLIRQHYLSIPNEYMQSARIDGAKEWQIFLHIMLPAGKSIMSCLAIFSALWRWNDYMWPLLVVRNTEKFTVQLALATFQGQYNVDWQTVIAMSVVTMVPMMIIFVIFQKQIINGMALSGLKE
ncbi:MAG: carbohydrate ABC transporter permease [Sphaerochaetaceae bacterium]|nr:carbohydrate ABC transporter permease [Sphaerochaetaceae bacterium]